VEAYITFRCIHWMPVRENSLIFRQSTHQPRTRIRRWLTYMVVDCSVWSDAIAKMSVRICASSIWAADKTAAAKRCPRTIAHLIHDQSGVGARAGPGKKRPSHSSTLPLSPTFICVVSRVPRRRFTIVHP